MGVTYPTMRFGPSLVELTSAYNAIVRLVWERGTRTLSCSCCQGSLFMWLLSVSSVQVPVSKIRNLLLSR